VHWVFAMKYWSVAQQLQLLKLSQDPNQFNQRNRYIYIVGIAFNLIGGLMYGVPLFSPWMIILEQVMQLGIIVSCIFLVDAFRRLK